MRKSASSGCSGPRPASVISMARWMCATPASSSPMFSATMPRLFVDRGAPVRAALRLVDEREGLLEFGPRLLVATDEIQHARAIDEQADLGVGVAAVAHQRRFGLPSPAKRFRLLAQIDAVQLDHPHRGPHRDAFVARLTPEQERLIECSLGLVGLRALLLQQAEEEHGSACSGAQPISSASTTACFAIACASSNRPASMCASAVWMIARVASTAAARSGGGAPIVSCGAAQAEGVRSPCTESSARTMTRVSGSRSTSPRARARSSSACRQSICATDSAGATQAASYSCVHAAAQASSALTTRGLASTAYASPVAAKPVSTAVRTSASQTPASRSLAAR